MTRTEYTAYVDAVTAGAAREVIRLDSLSGYFDDDTGERTRDPYFSWQPCPLCSRSQGGTRSDQLAASADGTGTVELQHVCDDCVYFAAYGRLDDTTMFQVEADIAADLYPFVLYVDGKSVESFATFAETLAFGHGVAGNTECGPPVTSWEVRDGGETVFRSHPQPAAD